MNKEQQKKIVIYCRVSTKEQADEGGSLLTQEKACKEYALKNNLEVSEIFIEYGESAKTADRTQLKKMLAYCSEKKNGIQAVVIPKVDRLSRNTYDYGNIEIYLDKYNVEIISISENIEKSPMGNLTKTMLTGFAQFDNEIRAERCAGGMKEAVIDGRYVWMAPAGYTNATLGGKPNIVPNEMAPLIKETFEMIGTGLYAVEDVRRTMTDKGLLSRKEKPILKSYFYKLLRNKTYTGWIEKFNEIHKGHFEAIISEELFNRVQRVLKNRGKKMSQYKLDNEDFPLRRFIFGPNNQKLTGSWSKGRSKKYPFYRFSQKGTNFKRDILETKFREEMDKYSLEPKHLIKLRKFLTERLQKSTRTNSIGSENSKIKIGDLEVQQNILIQKNLNGFISDELLKRQLDEISNKIFELRAVLNDSEGYDHDPEELIRYAEEYLTNPGVFWKNSKFETRVKLQWFQFPSGLTFDGTNFGTIEIANVFKTKEAFQPLLSIQVDLTGLEPATSSVQVRRSSQMSYRPE